MKPLVLIYIAGRDGNGTAILENSFSQMIECQILKTCSKISGTLTLSNTKLQDLNQHSLWVIVIKRGESKMKKMSIMAFIFSSIFTEAQ